MLRLPMGPPLTGLPSMGGRCSPGLPCDGARRSLCSTPMGPPFTGLPSEGAAFTRLYPYGAVYRSGRCFPCCHPYADRRSPGCTLRRPALTGSHSDGGRLTRLPLDGAAVHWALRYRGRGSATGLQLDGGSVQRLGGSGRERNDRPNRCRLGDRELGWVLHGAASSSRFPSHADH